jgi:hypothetical protein
VTVSVGRNVRHSDQTAFFQHSIDARPADSEPLAMSVALGTAAPREQKMTCKYATMRVLAGCYPVSAIGPPGACDVEVNDDMRNSFDG